MMNAPFTSQLHQPVLHGMIVIKTAVKAMALISDDVDLKRVQTSATRIYLSYKFLSILSAGRVCHSTGSIEKLGKRFKGYRCRSVTRTAVLES